ncbi:nuclear transport factor 2 family protein [Phenylobacterium sp.]|uniref:nuclear transport factor 2 family protein n=1 Tax=Phenylobacterium sp. TaxID=1871053 RepID=UPI002737DC88|nr:nuclear transport factor 2 family protein [Phenylobacterium sp.]MDP3867547.1 nuclear transport factor 2 family protein [Phenylobacterium sp.]
MSDRDPEVQALLDKKAIEEVLVLALRGCDRADIDLVAASYHDDAFEDHGGTFAGPASQWLESLRTRLPKAGLMNHVMTNLMIELSGDTAVAESYITTYTRTNLDGGDGFDSATLARTVDRFEKRAGKWKIARRTLVWEWNRETPITETWARGGITSDPSILRRGGKKPNDALYQA